LSKKPLPFQLGDSFELTIESLSFNGGRGVARYEGFVLFIPLCIPGERIRARVTEIKKNFAIAQLTEIIEASPLRREPPCEYFSRCGGCSWQHMTYEMQLEQKEKIVAGLLEKQGKISTEIIRPILPSPSEFRYRNRIQLQKQKEQIGYYARSSHSLVAINDCKIADEDLDAEFARVRENAQSSRVEIALSPEGIVVVRESDSDEEISLFSQVNTRQNEKLIQLVLEAASELQSKFRIDRVLDLYCGSGNFTFPLADLLPQSKVTGVELSASSVRLAQKKANPGYLQKTNFVAGNVANYLEGLTNLDKTLVVVDPPRTGLGSDVCRELRRLNPHWLIYISCNPTTFIRDVVELTQIGTNRVRFVQPVDMFPQTDHVELVSLIQMNID
jgi:23S rRNA (uracil1939-C5)-methyltransferase